MWLRMSQSLCFVNSLFIIEYLLVYMYMYDLLTLTFELLFENFNAGYNF
jgi:hypothetical protein